MAAKGVTEYRFLLVGKSGSGKTSTANNIIGEKKFEIAMGVAAGIKTCEVKTSSKPKNGVTFTIVDTPGLFDPTRTNEELGDQIIKASALLHPGLHAILYVVQIGRYTPEEFDTFKQLKEIFDANVVKYIIIILTKGDELKQSKMSLKNLLDKADEPFKEVLRECGNRVLVVNNVNYDQKHTKELLEMVEKILKENGEVPYTCALQDTVNVKLECRVTIRTQERIEKEPALKSIFDEMGEHARKAKKEMEDQQRCVEETRIKKEKAETMIREREEQERKEREEKERQERAEKEMKDLQEKKKIEEEEEEEEEERKRKGKEFENLRKTAEALKKELEINQKVAEEKKKLQKEFEKIIKEEKKKYEKEEMEKIKGDIANNIEKHWVQDVLDGGRIVVRGLWKGWKALWR